jgi:hypothetical protein
VADTPKPWEAVFGRVRVTRSAEVVCAPKMTRGELDAFETELGTNLPASYREFAARFGLHGGIAGRARLYAPTTLQPDRWGVLPATKWIREYATHDGAAARYCAPAQLAKFVVFGDDFARGYFAWDGSSMSDATLPEYPIYRLPRMPGLIEARATTFFGFLEGLATYVPEPPTHAMTPLHEVVIHDGMPGEIRFHPFSLRRKQLPAELDVNNWLAFNNNAVRDLALAIRDHGRTEAFPVLADALEEAGCTNADVLDSCRRGDPDIDGLWVLRVLLGK